MKKFNVRITNKNGVIVNASIYASTLAQAIEKAYNKFN